MKPLELFPPLARLISGLRQSKNTSSLSIRRSECDPCDFSLPLLASCWSCVSPLSAADAGTPQVPEAVKQAMQDRNYAEAVKAIDEAAKAEGCAAGLPGLPQGPRAAPEREVRRGAAGLRSGREGASQEPLGPPGPLRQGAVAGPQGRFPGGGTDLPPGGGLPALRRPQAGDRRIYLEFADAYFKPAEENQTARLCRRRWSSSTRRWRSARSRRSGSKSSCWWPVLPGAGQPCRGGRAGSRSSSRTIRGMRWRSKPASGWASASWPGPAAGSPPHVAGPAGGARRRRRASGSPEAAFNLASTYGLPAPQIERGPEPGRGGAGVVRREVPGAQAGQPGASADRQSYMPAAGTRTR